MLYKTIESIRTEFSVEKICKALSISRSGYYKWKSYSRVPVRDKDFELLVEIKKIYGTSKGRFGSPKINAKLRENGIIVNHKRIERIMRENNIRSKTTKKFKGPSSSKHCERISSNLLDRDFSPSYKDQAWCSDITYIRTKEGWLYLAVVIDLFSRKVIGWSMSDNMKKEIVINAFNMAWEHRNRPANFIFHSDRGSQYGSDEFRYLLFQSGAIQSMSRKGNCWDNACAESFFASLKKEEVYQKEYKTIEEAKSCIFEYTELFYNAYRPHSFCAGVSPNTFEFKNNHRNIA